MNNLEIGIIQGRLSPSSEMMFFPFETWEAEFPIAQKIGFNAIEWAFCKENSEKNPILSEEGIAKIKNLSKKHNIKISSVCGYYFIDSDFTDKTAEDAAKKLNRLIIQSSKIGAKRILIPFLGGSEIKTENQKKEIIKNLQPCLKTTELHGIELAFETSLPADELKKFITRFDNKFIKVYYDTGNMTTFVGDKVPEEIRKLNGLIGAVHIKDRKFWETTSYPLGKGDTDFNEIFKALKEINFVGPLILEAARDPNTDNEILCGQYFGFIKKQLQALN